MEPSDLASLPTLDALLQEGSVTGAARRLGLSTPAVSHALARLRARLGDPLLVRAGRGMVRTPRAEALRARTQDAMAAAERVFEVPASLEPASLEGHFTVSTTDYVLQVMGDVLDARLLSLAPRLDLRVVLNAPDDDERLRSGETDLAVGIYGALPPELRTRPLLTDRLVCVVRADHPIVRRRLTLEQFVALEHVQVAPRGRPGGHVDRLLEERGLTRRVARAVPFFRSGLELTARSDRVLTVSERIARSLGPDLGLRVLEPPLPFDPYTLSMVWHPRFDGDAGHRWLREALLSAAQEVAPEAHDDAVRRLTDAEDPKRRRRPRGRRG